MTISLSQQIWFSFPFQVLIVQSMLHCQSDSRLRIQQVCAFTHVLLAAPTYLQARPSISMSNWISERADAVEQREAAQAPLSSQTPVPAILVDDAPTEPALSPRMREVPVNDGRWTTEEYAESLFYITQDLHERDQVRLQELWDRQQADARPNPLADMERERRRAEAAEYQAHQRSIQEWEAQIEARGLDNAAVPCGPTPAGTSSLRALPNVHAALRQNDPKMASFSQPAVKKAPPTSGRPMRLMQSLQGLVHCQCNLHHLQLHDQLMLPVRDFHWQQLR